MYNYYMMKHRSLLFIGLITSGLSLSSCNFADILADKLKLIEISQESIPNYVVGESFFDKCELVITGIYYSGDTKKLNKNEVTFNLTLNGATKNIYTPFTSEGSYKLTVSKDNIKSKTLTVSVYETANYVSDIDVKGQNTIEENRTVPLSLSVAPTNFTVPITYTYTNSNVISVSKVSETSYEVKGLSLGGADITFKALKDESNYFEKVFHVSVIESQKVKIEQTYSDFVHNNYYNTSNCPTVGDVNLLVIPVWFKDSQSYFPSSYQNNVKDDINKVFFGTKEQTGWHSVKSFYEEESDGLLTLNGKISEWYTPDVTSLQANAFSNKEQATFIKTATNWYFNNHEDSRKKYDSDEDGYLDGVMFIYAAPDYQVYSSFSGNMWAYCYYVQDTSLKNKDNPGVNGFFWASYDFMYGSNKAYERSGGGYCNGDTSHCLLDSHTYTHEMGHMFGLEDYYDYSKTTSPTAGFSMQDNNVGGHDPYSTMAFGWSDPYIPTGSCEITINDFQSSHDIILLSPSWNKNNSPFDEYLLLELYTPTELNKFDSDYQYDGNYPRGPHKAGIRLWHVDARLMTTTGKFINDAKSSSKFYTAFNNTYKTATEDENGRNAFSYDITYKDDYQRFNLLHLIRQAKSGQSYMSTADLSETDLFVANSTFDMESYKSQFYKNNGLLDSGIELGWSFKVKNIVSDTDESYATIELIKA